MKFIRKYPEKNWTFYNISKNPNIKLEDILNNLDLPWDWNFISMNPNITPDIIEKNPKLQRNWNVIELNPNLNLKFIEKKFNKINELYRLSQNIWERIGIGVEFHLIYLEGIIQP